MIELKIRKIIAVSGAEARPFLDKLMTTDTPQDSQLAAGALLTPQGRIIAQYIAFGTPDGALFDVHESVADAFIKRLMLFKLRARITISARADLAIHWAQTEAEVSAADGLSLFGADPRSAELGFRGIRPTGLSSEPEDRYHARRIALGIAEQGQDFGAEDSFPADVNMDHLNGVAFKKGCFVGQEVVSRMKRRGTARRRVLAARFEGVAPMPGTEIMAGGSTLGETGSHADGHVILKLRIDRLAKADGDILAGETVLSPIAPDWLAAEQHALLEGKS
jgi:folate-binding protein YgfZ